jgi:predicted nucleic acid-binding protein
VIYLDSSVVLAHLLVEDRQPPIALWDQSLVSSRLLEYELWTRLHARRLGASHGEEARALLARVTFVELTPPVLTRALEPWPVPLRTLDALHLASMAWVIAQRQSVALASYDERQIAVASALGFQIADAETTSLPS